MESNVFSIWSSEGDSFFYVQVRAEEGIRFLLDCAGLCGEVCPKCGVRGIGASRGR